MKTFKLLHNGEEHHIHLEVSFYEMGGNLGIRLVEHDGEPWSTLTINLIHEPKCAKDCAYVNTYNNGKEISDWLMENGLAAPTGRVSCSGYPEYQFDPHALAEADPQGYAVYLIQLTHGICPRMH